MLDGPIQRVNDTHRELHPEVLGTPVLVACNADRHAVRRRTRRLVADQLDSGLVKLRKRSREEVARHRAVHKQRLGRVTHSGPLHLGVERNPARHLKIRVRVDVNVAVPSRGIDHRYGRNPLERLLQTLATAGNNEIHHPLEGGELPQLLASATTQQLDGALRQTSVANRLLHDGGERGIRVHGRARPPQDCRVAALQAQRGAINRHVGPRLIDDRDNPKRDPNLRQLQPAAHRPLLQDLANRIREGDDLEHAVGHRVDASRVQRQPIDERCVQARLNARGQIKRVRFKNVRRTPAEQLGYPLKRSVLVLRRCARQPARRTLRPRARITRAHGSNSHASSVPT